MAAAMGIRTPCVDALTFGLGSGIAGMAGVRAVADRQRRPRPRARATSSTRFMVVVFGGVGNLVGTLCRRARRSASSNKFLEPLAGAVLGQDRRAGVHHPLHPEAARRACSRSKGRAVEA
jgi:urea transport system permease protein